MFSTCTNAFSSMTSHTCERFSFSTHMNTKPYGASFWKGILAMSSTVTPPRSGSRDVPGRVAVHRKEIVAEGGQICREDGEGLLDAVGQRRLLRLQLRGGAVGLDDTTPGLRDGVRGSFKMLGARGSRTFFLRMSSWLSLL